MLKTLLPIVVIIAAYLMAGQTIGTIALVAFLCVFIYNNFPNIYSLIAQRKFALGDVDGAISWFEKAYKTNRLKPSAVVFYGYLLLKNGDIKRAGEITNHALKYKHIQAADKVMAMHNLSLIKYKQGDLEGAMNDVSEIFSEYKNTLLYGTLGYYKILSNATDAYEFCKKAYEYNEDDATILDNIMQSCIIRGDFDEAKIYADKAMSRKPKFIEAYYHASIANFELSHLGEAKKYIDEAKNCKRSFMTTISEYEIEELDRKIQEKINAEV